MKNRFFAATVLGCLLFGQISCKQGDSSEISTDLVSNPASAEGATDNASVPVMSFEQESHDFGKIKQGEKVSYSFKFKNTGKGDLLIANAVGSCGCTVPDYPKNPVKSGDESMILVTFDSAGKSGKVTKTVTLTSNTIPNTKVLTITAEILVP